MTTSTVSSVFETYERRTYPYAFRGKLHLFTIAGGVPTDPKKAEGWLKSRVTASDDLVQEEIARIMAERQVPMDEALEIVNVNRHLNGFRRDPETGELFIMGYQLKAAIREAANIRWPKERWGISKKGTLSYWAEHVFVQEERLGLGVKEPSDVAQHFVHTWRGNGIQYTEFCEDVEVNFTLLSDTDFHTEKFTDAVWPELWVTGQEQGLGASRKLGYGRYKVTEWEEIPAPKSTKKVKAKAKATDDGWEES